MAGGPQRREYRLTAAGARALSGKTGRLGGLCRHHYRRTGSQVMPEHRLIRDCLAELAAQFPPPVVAES